MDANISYIKERTRRYEYHPGTKSMEAKPSKQICPISNLPMGAGDERRRYFLVRGKKVAVNVESFLNRCGRAGWPKPEIKRGDDFDIEPWLADRARGLAQMPVNQIRRGLIDIAEFARLIGLDIKLVKIVKIAKKAK